MKISTLVIICSLFGLSACNSDSKNNGLSINFDRCTIGGHNEISIGRLERAYFKDAWFELRTKKESSEYKSYKEKLGDQLFFATGNKGGVVLEDDEGRTAFGLSMNGRTHAYPSLSVYAGVVESTPNLPARPSQREFEAIFSNEIVNQQSADKTGLIIDYDLLLCGKYPAEVYLPADHASNEEKELWYPLKIRISLKSIELKSSEAYEKTSKFSAGSSIHVLYQNGVKCEGVITLPGEPNSKVEYTEWCEIGFANSVSDGETMWVPNTAIIKR